MIINIHLQTIRLTTHVIKNSRRQNTDEQSCTSQTILHGDGFEFIM
jgi:hypothetical protein